MPLRSIFKAQTSTSLQLSTLASHTSPTRLKSASRHADSAYPNCSSRDELAAVGRRFFRFSLQKQPLCVVGEGARDKAHGEAKAAAPCKCLRDEDLGWRKRRRSLREALGTSSQWLRKFAATSTSLCRLSSHRSSCSPTGTRRQ